MWPSRGSRASGDGKVKMSDQILKSNYKQPYYPYSALIRQQRVRSRRPTLCEVAREGGQSRRGHSLRDLMRGKGELGRRRGAPV